MAYALAGNRVVPAAFVHWIYNSRIAESRSSKFPNGCKAAHKHYVHLEEISSVVLLVISIKTSVPIILPSIPIIIIVNCYIAVLADDKGDNSLHPNQ